MLEAIGREEQPHPIRRAAANIATAHRYVMEFDQDSPDAFTMSGILMSLDRCVRLLGASVLQADLRGEAHQLAKHANTIDRIREEIGRTPHKAAQLPMREAHDALIEAANKLAHAKAPFLPF